MFSLYYSRKNRKLEIAPIKKHNLMISKATDEVTVYNDCYYICNDRKKLKDKANEIINKRIKELEDELNGIRKIKIKNRY